MAALSFWGAISAHRRLKSLIAMAIFTAGFVLIGFSISLPMVQHFDLRVSREIQESGGTPLDQVMLFGTFLGSSPAICGVAIVVSAFMFSLKLPRMGVFVLLTLVSLPVDLVLKLIWGRDRPNPMAVHVLLPAPGSSFPSGHVLGTTALYGFLALLAWIHLPKKGGRLPFVIVLAAMIPYVAVSRIYVGAHWLSDVVGALAIGLVLLVVLVTLYHVDPEEASTVAKTAQNLGSAVKT